MAFTLPALPYDIDALDPHISANTLTYHYGKHHKAYVDNLNNLILKEDFPTFKASSLEEIILKSNIGSLFNQAAQVWNHTFYWHCMTPNKNPPSSFLKGLIQNAFGSLEEFKALFTNVALSTFGSGWTWLVLDENGSLSIQSTSNAESPLKKKMVPLLTCDVWEHAYYLDYQNQRANYLKAFWEVTHWSFIESNLEAKERFIHPA